MSPMSYLAAPPRDPKKYYNRGRGESQGQKFAVEKTGKRHKMQGKRKREEKTSMNLDLIVKLERKVLKNILI
jgi:hypothetical protein